MAESDSREIAALIAKECKKKGISYNNTKIQKLLYCCYGVMLAWKNARICDEYPRLWPYGPVFPKVFNYIHKYGDIANFSTDISKVSTPENKEVIESVLNAFGKYDATSLSSWSHTEGSPWDRAKQENANWNSFIPDEYIKGPKKCLMTSQFLSWKQLGLFPIPMGITTEKTQMKKAQY